MGESACSDRGGGGGGGGDSVDTKNMARGNEAADSPRGFGQFQGVKRAPGTYIAGMRLG